MVLAILVAVYACCWMDRYLMIILIEPIRLELQLSDTQMGLLTGFAFTVMYSLAGLPFAYWADRKSRRVVLAIAALGWSIATMLSSLGRDFKTLALARFGVAAFEAGCSPTAYSLISDYFPASHRSRAIAIYSLGTSLGIWGGLTLGGAVSAHYGWRAAFVVLGIPAAIMSVLVFLFVREPPRGGQDRARRDSDTRYSLAESARLILGRRSFVGAAFALGTLTITSTAFLSWAPAYLIRVRGLDTAQVGMIGGSIVGFSGILGTLGVGLLCDRLARRDSRWYLWLPLIGFALFLPFERLFFASSGVWTYAFYFLAALASATYAAPLFTVGQFVLPPRLRALGAAVMLLVLNLLGMGGGSFAVGLLSDLLRPRYGEASLQHAILLLQAAALIGFACLLWAAAAIRRETECEAAA
ncbi:MAG: spinster family MFS transporter [Solimonas sp.]